MENVEHHVAVIGDNPLARREAIDRLWPDSMIFPEPFLDFVDDRLQMRLRSARTDHEKLGETRDPAQIERDDPLRFFIGDDARAELG
jgi:hypothetical protein